MFLAESDTCGTLNSVAEDAMMMKNTRLTGTVLHLAMELLVESSRNNITVIGNLQINEIVGYQTNRSRASEIITRAL